MVDAKRRAFLALLGGAMATRPGQVLAQTRANQSSAKRIAYLGPAVPAADASHAAVFEQGLRQGGWIPGRNLTIDYRYTHGRQDLIAPVVAEVATANYDAILAWSPPIALAVKRATQAPLVFLIAFDPVEVGLVSNLAAPGGSVTGVTSLASLEIIAKRLQLLKEVIPSLRSVAVLLSTEQIRSQGGHEALISAAHAMNVTLRDVQVATPDELDPAIRKAKEQGVEALYVWPSGFAFAFAKQIAESAKAYRLPALHPFRENVLAGGLMAFAADIKQSAELGADYITRILNGTLPGSLPVHQLARYELLVNLKTAKELELQFPPTVIAGASEVIE